MSVTLSRPLADEMIRHCIEGRPNEACGIIGSSNGTAVKVFRMTNAAGSPVRYALDGKEQLALAKDIQRDAIKPVIDHVDLVVVRKGEKVTVDVPVQLVGTAAVETVVTVENNTVELSVEATHIPERIEISIEGAEAGTQIHASGLVLPKGAELVTDAETLIVNVTQAISAEALEAELAGDVTVEAAAEAVAAEEAAEGEAPAAEGAKA